MSWCRAVVVERCKGESEHVPKAEEARFANELAYSTGAKKIHN